MVTIVTLYKKTKHGFKVKELVDEHGRRWHHSFTKGQHVFFQKDGANKKWTKMKGVFIPLSN